MSTTPPRNVGDDEEMALQLIKESLVEDKQNHAHVFVVLGASVCYM